MAPPGISPVVALHEHGLKRTLRIAITAQELRENVEAQLSEIAVLRYVALPDAATTGGVVLASSLRGADQRGSTHRGLVHLRDELGSEIPIESFGTTFTSVPAVLHAAERRLRPAPSRSG